MSSSKFSGSFFTQKLVQYFSDALKTLEQSDSGVYDVIVFDSLLALVEERPMKCSGKLLFIISVFCIILTLAGLIIGFAWLYMIAWSDVEPFCDVAAWDVFYDALVNLIGILIGALIAVGIFLVTVLKS